MVSAHHRRNNGHGAVTRLCAVVMLAAAAACAAGEPASRPALTREQSAVLIALLDDVRPEALRTSDSPAARGRLRAELGRLRRALADGGPADLERHASRVRQLVMEVPPKLELVLSETEAAARPHVDR